MQKGAGMRGVPRSRAIGINSTLLSPKGKEGKCFACRRLEYWAADIIQDEGIVRKPEIIDE